MQCAKNIFILNMNEYVQVMSFSKPHHFPNRKIDQSNNFAKKAIVQKI